MTVYALGVKAVVKDDRKQNSKKMIEEVTHRFEIWV